MENQKNDRKRILIVDDDDMIRGIYAEVLRDNGFEVEEAQDGLEGLEKAREIIPDAVFTGIIMPKMEGFDLMEALKKNVATSQIPVFISSHLGREEDKKRAQELGAKDFFVKDFDTPNEVVAKIKDFFENGHLDIRIDFKELDGEKLVQQLSGGQGMTCPNCRKERVARIKLIDAKAGKFEGRFICPDCETK